MDKYFLFFNGTNYSDFASAKINSLEAYHLAILDDDNKIVNMTHRIMGSLLPEMTANVILNLDRFWVRPNMIVFPEIILIGRNTDALRKSTQEAKR